MTTILKIYKLITLLLIIESALILIGINRKLLTYGADEQNSIMTIFLFLGLVIATILLLTVKDAAKTRNKIIMILTGIIMILCGWFYLFDDSGFWISWIS